MTQSELKAAVPARRERAGFGLFALLTVIAAVYLSTLAVNHTEAEDSLWYLRSISTGTLKDQFHPNHLLYNYANHIVYRGLQALGYRQGPETPVSVVNVAGALMILAFCWKLARAAGVPLFAGYAALLLTASAYGFWWYSVECETYILPIVFVFLTFGQILRIRREFANPFSYLLLGAFIALAILFHQQHVLLIPVVLGGYLAIFSTQRKKISGSRFLRGLFLFGLSCAALVGVLYLLVAVLVEEQRTLPSIMGWLKSGSEAGGYGYGLLAGFFKGIIGFSRAYIGGHYLFGFPAVTSLLERLIPNYELAEEIFLVRDLSPLLRAALLVLTAGGLACACLAAYRAWISSHFAHGNGTKNEELPQTAPRRKTRPHTALGAAFAPDADGGLSTRQLLLVLLLLYVAVYGLFNIWYLPESIEVWISLVPVTALLLALLAGGPLQKRFLRLLVSGAITCLFVVNLLGSVLPQHDHTHDFWYQFNGWLLGDCRPGDLVVSGSGYISDGYVAFYCNAKVLSTLDAGDSFQGQFDKTVAWYAPHRILIVSTVYQRPPQLTSQAHSITPAARQFFEEIRPRLTLLHSDAWQEVYLYKPAG